MKNKGFTLIELLAVIVILAVVALIATPAVLNIIEDSRQSAAEASAKNIVSAAKTYSTNQIINNEQVDVINLTSDTLKYDGEKATKGFLVVDNNGKVNGKMYVGGYCVEVSVDGTVVSTKAEENDCDASKPKTYIIDFTRNVGISSIEPNSVSFTYNGKTYVNEQVEVYEGTEIIFTTNSYRRAVLFKYEEDNTNRQLLADNRVNTTAKYIVKNNISFSNYSIQQQFLFITLLEGDRNEIIFNANGGIIPEDNEWYGSGDVAKKHLISGLKYGTLPEPEKEGYTFIDWYDANDNEIINTTTFTKSDNNTIYARWELAE